MGSTSCVPRQQHVEKQATRQMRRGMARADPALIWTAIYSGPCNYMAQHLQYLLTALLMIRSCAASRSTHVVATTCLPWLPVMQAQRPCIALLTAFIISDVH